jgi:hypothetical protein
VWKQGAKSGGCCSDPGDMLLTWTRIVAGKVVKGSQNLDAMKLRARIC